MKIFSKSKVKEKGLTWIILAIISKISFGKINLRIENLINNYRGKISKKIAKKYNYTVQNGIFKGLKIQEKQWWGIGDVAIKCLGYYEIEVQDVIERVQRENNLNTFIDIGGADGYFALGLIKNKIFEQSFIFEISSLGRKSIKNGSRLNQVEDRISIYGEATQYNLTQILNEKNIELKNTLLLCDIEGEEYNLINQDLLNFLRDSYIIIELHFFNNDLLSKKNKFLELLASYHSLNIFNSLNRVINISSEFYLMDENERALLLSEGRSHIGEWVLLSPKKTQS
mgnify:CR=1 FL=1|tara:strand:+ start:5201 stop:6052 length:852 start_codon:yes stop_codon:yes gene_type:complete